MVHCELHHVVTESSTKQRNVVQEDQDVDYLFFVPLCMHGRDQWGDGRMELLALPPFQDTERYLWNLV